MTTRLPTTVPFFSRRSMAAAAWNESIFFFGGVGAHTGTESILDVSDELWHLDTNSFSWRRIGPCRLWPEPRRCAGFTAAAAGIVLWGGSGIYSTPEGKVRHTFLNDFWQYDPLRQQWKCLQPTDDHRRTPLETSRQGTCPFPRYTPVFQAAGGRLFLFGGYTEDRLGKRKLNDAWLFDGSQWREVPRVAPAGYGPGSCWPGLRYGCMSASDGQSVYVCGGFSDEGDHIDLWRFDIRDNTWELLCADGEVASLPAPRYCAALAWHAGGLYLFGGRSRRYPKRNYNDLWRFDLTSRRWNLIEGNREPHRYDAAASFPGYHSKASAAVVGHWWYVLGGEGRLGHVSDFWRLDLRSCDWEMLSAAREDDPMLWAA